LFTMQIEGYFCKKSVKYVAKSRIFSIFIE
jgi:hypothetical protein